MQIVGYETGLSGVRYDPTAGVEGTPGSPALLIAEGGTVRAEPLAPGADLAYTLGERHCAGAIEGGEHVACEAGRAPHCEAHADTWRCAQCAGDCRLPLEACREEHAVYLAAFAPDTFKVGVTRTRRLYTRLREQGADRGAHVHTVSNGRIARTLEAEIASRVPDRVPVREKIAGLHEAVDAAAWETLLREFDLIERFAFDDGLGLSERPVTETLATGTVRGVKGRVLVVERAGSVYATDLRDLVGHEVVAGASDRDLQSTLGAFG